MSDNPIKKTLGNDKFYKLSKNLKAINFIPNKSKPDSRTYVSHAIFEGDVDFGDEKIEWLGEKPESFPEDKVSIVELIQVDNNKIYAHVFGQAGASKDDVDSLGNRISVLENFVSYEVYQAKTSLPTEGNSKIIYLVKKNDGSGNDYYDEYIWTKKEGEINAHYELIGNTSVNLSNYVSRDEFNLLESSLAITSGSLTSHMLDSDIHIEHYKDNYTEEFLIGNTSPSTYLCNILLNGSVTCTGPLCPKKGIMIDKKILISGDNDHDNIIYLYNTDKGSDIEFNVTKFTVGPLEVNTRDSTVSINGVLITNSSSLSSSSQLGSTDCPFIKDTNYFSNSTRGYSCSHSLLIAGPIIILGSGGPPYLYAGLGQNYHTADIYGDDQIKVLFDTNVKIYKSLFMEGPIFLGDGIVDKNGNKLSDFSSLNNTSNTSSSSSELFYRDYNNEFVSQVGSLTVKTSTIFEGPITFRQGVINSITTESDYYNAYSNCHTIELCGDLYSNTLLGGSIDKLTVNLQTYNYGFSYQRGGKMKLMYTNIIPKYITFNCNNCSVYGYTFSILLIKNEVMAFDEISQSYITSSTNQKPSAVVFEVEWFNDDQDKHIYVFVKPLYTTYTTM